MTKENKMTALNQGDEFLILVINPGSTSTKTAVFAGEEVRAEKTLSHSIEDLLSFQRVYEQLEYRREAIMEFLGETGIQVDKLSCVVGRGGLLRPLEGGTYQVDEEMCQYLRDSKKDHASNLGAILAKSVADCVGIPAFIVDPVVVDEMEPLARITGLKGIERKSIFHALNQKAVARKAATSLGKTYSECNFVVAHMGGGVSVGAHCRGRVIDVNDALSGDGPFSSERSGGVPSMGLVELVYSGVSKEDEIKKALVGKGGLVSYLGTNDAREVEKRIAQGDTEASLVLEAMAYQVAKDIGSYAAVLKGKLDAVLITGGLAHSVRLVNWIKERVSFLAPVLIFPGEGEMEALAGGAFNVLTGQEECKRIKLF